MAAGDQSKSPRPEASRGFQAPKGTRDLYPQDLLRRRYIEKMWRDTSIRHGFEEIDGPTFEHLDLYTAKSGEGIVSEIFGVFSGKDEGELAEIRAGKPAPFALRPEFTPTLARMYAAKAGSLPKPCKWFWQQNCFRAERPQRGRLREFGQWNCDVIGAEDEVGADLDVVCCCVDLLQCGGLSSQDAVVGYSNRKYIDQVLMDTYGIPPANLEGMRALLDRATKMGVEAFDQEAIRLGVRVDQVRWLSSVLGLRPLEGTDRWGPLPPVLTTFRAAVTTVGIDGWCDFRPSIVRGLAYYTGMVFEIHEASGAERAIAGGGRYDNLIETFGGPATPSVGFGMGDVVLSLVLQDRGLMPEGKDLLSALSAPSASLRPDVFVISNGTPEADAQVRPLVARLRRGEEAAAWRDKSGRKPWDADRYVVPPLHARHSYKATKNVGKLLQEATASHARFAVIVESEREVTVRDLDRRDEVKGVAVGEVGKRVSAPVRGGF